MSARSYRLRRSSFDMYTSSLYQFDAIGLMHVGLKGRLSQYSNHLITHAPDLGFLENKVCTCPTSKTYMTQSSRGWVPEHMPGH